MQLSMIALLALLLASCGATAPPAGCPMPTAEDERAAFLARVAELRALPGIVVPMFDEASVRGLPRLAAREGLFVTAQGVSWGTAPGSLFDASDDEVAAMLAGADPMRLGTLLAPRASTIIVPIIGGRILPSEVQGGETGFLLTELLAELQSGRMNTDSPLILAVAPRTPYRVVTQVVYTAGQASMTRFDVAVSAGGTLYAKNTHLPAFRGGEDFETLRQTQVALTLTNRGAVVGSGADTWGEGCEHLASDGIAVPSESSLIDHERLRRCLRRIKNAAPSRTTLVVSADSDVPFGDVMSTIIAAAFDSQGTLFPEYNLSAGVR